ncbi:MAG TPA: 50S ribosomal protein L28 [Chloroflexota bacterium]|nr:50S ribosomal protein L28 [Chloroflexota bacterium]
MAARCEICGKGTTFGRSIRHKAGGGWFRRAPVTSRTFKPNLQNVTLDVNGAPKKLRICTRCLRTQHKQAKG